MFGRKWKENIASLLSQQIFDRPKSTKSLTPPTRVFTVCLRRIRRKLLNLKTSISSRQSKSTQWTGLLTVEPDCRLAACCVIDSLDWIPWQIAFHLMTYSSPANITKKIEKIGWRNIQHIMYSLCNQYQRVIWLPTRYLDSPLADCCPFCALPSWRLETEATVHRIYSLSQKPWECHWNMCV